MSSFHYRERVGIPRDRGGHSITVVGAAMAALKMAMPWRPWRRIHGEVAAVAVHGAAFTAKWRPWRSVAARPRSSREPVAARGSNFGEASEESI
jgi:hypothetical protein